MHFGSFSNDKNTKHRRPQDNTHGLFKAKTSQVDLTRTTMHQGAPINNAHMIAMAAAHNNKPLYYQKRV